MFIGTFGTITQISKNCRIVVRPFIEIVNKNVNGIILKIVTCMNL